jgi:mono/diheme cytochrome c family protein
MAPLALLVSLPEIGKLASAADPKSVDNKPPIKIDYAKEVAPFLTKHCTSCHSGSKPKGDLALDSLNDEAAALKKPEIWDGIAERLRSKEMPPKKKPQPTEAERGTILGWIDSAHPKADCTINQDPGRPTLRRLNRVEYNNTIRDLVGVDFHPAENSPADDIGYGFDNIGDVLSMPPILMEKYLTAADKIVAKAFSKPETRKRIVICEPGDKVPNQDTARKILEAFVTRAYRRPATSDEVNRLVKLFEVGQKSGDTFDMSIGLSIQAVLVSPNFLFRVEQDRDPNDPKGVHPINQFELASRLSYFLWSSMPDDELFELAKKESLRKPEILEGQVKRMLRDTKSHALSENFAGQWLQTRRLETSTPDPKLFKGYSLALKADMAKEIELFFEAIMREDRGVLDFLDADFTFLNERLAVLYGIDGIKGDEFRRVKLTGDQRGGVLTMAGILTITSNPTRTSPVKRGKWILENILGSPPPPPPPEAGELSEKKDIVESASLRKRMEQHRADPNCATCHQKMDPLGFGFENYDAVGAWRTKDGKFDIDPAGVLPDGKSFNGPKELKIILKGKEKEFRKCLADRLLTYALGRGLEAYDKCAVDQIADNLAKNEYRFSGLVINIVTSSPFQMRRGTGPPSKGP